LVFNEEGYGYVWEKEGLIHVLDTNGVRLETPFLDIREECATWADHGINSVALDPFFAENGYYYVGYVVERNYLFNKDKPDYNPDLVLEEQATIGRIARFQADISTNFTTTIEGSQKILLGETHDTGIPILNIFHGIGSVIASPDGSLLISVGDATPGWTFDLTGGDNKAYANQALDDGILSPDQMLNAYRAYYLGSYNGKVLRIDAETGQGLSSNPYFNGNVDDIQSKIWSRGLRNPYRMAMRPNTSGHDLEEGQPGTLFIGDVGDGGWEELNIAKTGGDNFGWPRYESNRVHFYYGNFDHDLPNLLAPNPLFEEGGCDQEFFTFLELIKNASNPPAIFTNPCNNLELIPAKSYPAMETPAALSYSNQRWNQPSRARASIWNDSGTISYPNIDEADSPISGELFDGYSCMAGVFYQGNRFPDEYSERLFLYDYSGWIKVLTLDENHDIIHVAPFHNNATKINHLAENPKDGCLYYVNTDNQLRKICFGGNPNPIAVAQADKFYGNSPLSVQFDASESYDIFNLPIVSYEWDFGNGMTSSAMNPVFEFSTTDNNPTAFPVKLTVTDSLGGQGSTELLISLNNTPPVVDISSLETGWNYKIDEGSPVELIAQVSDNEQDISELTFDWQIDLHHNVHSHPGTTRDDQNSFFLVTNVGCDGQDYWYRVNLTVTDNAGLKTTTHRIVFPDCEPDFATFDNMDVVWNQNKPAEFKFSLESTEEIDHIEIQRSQDYLHYSPIGEVAFNASNNRYQFLDESPLDGTNLYRVKVVTKTGRFAYSTFTKGNLYDQADVFVFPNPVSNFFTLHYENPTSEKLAFRLFNAAGQEILNGNWISEIGQPFEKELSAYLLGDGVYYYQVLDGEKRSSGSFLVNR